MSGRHTRTVLLVAAVAAATAACQAGESTVQVKPDDRQVDEAVLAAPEGKRAGAGVLGYAADGEVELLREGSNELLCLADDPES
ncbi:MAG: hypothetical protein ABEJ00_00680, partial [Gemmatimonadota bacterium]